MVEYIIAGVTVYYLFNKNTTLPNKNITAQNKVSTSVKNIPADIQIAIEKCVKNNPSVNMLGFDGYKLLKSIAKIESDYNKNAIGVTGDYGL
jgi:hypothetical protein